MQLANIFKRKKNNVKTESVFSREYLIGITKFDTLNPKIKQIESYLKDEARQWLKTEDYYYGYYVESGYLKYIIHKSSSHDVGKLSKLTPVLLNEGNYYIIDNDNCYRYINKGHEIEDKIEYTTYKEQDEYATHNLETFPSITGLPKSLYLQWSLARRSFHINTCFIVIFSLSIATYLYSSLSYADLSEKAEQLKSEIEVQKKTISETVTPDLSLPIKAMQKAIDGKGIISEIKLENKVLVCMIEFNNENDARTFIKTYGGLYENGKVILAANMSASK